jgi:2-keto-4-pentenoate hydratase/2-oxohepta-3-ene-1,7-dioic acid hydratase in catechol pathway
MRLATIQTPAGPRPAVFHNNSYIDLHATDPTQPVSVRELLERGPTALKAADEVSRRPAAVRYPADRVRLLPPIPDPHKIICLGLNYRDHAAEGGVPVPKEPVLFSKFATTLIGHEDSIVLPKVSTQVDYEAELVFVIGKGGRHISKDAALAHVAGYTIGHDVSARDWQFKEAKQWLSGKTFDTFAPLGPNLVTADEVPNPGKLNIQLRLNGQTMQNSNTEQMIFDVAFTLSYISQVVTLQPGDIVFTGTPPGVGFVRKPPVFLKPGDVVEVEIESLGLLRNTVVGEQAAK